MTVVDVTGGVLGGCCQVIDTLQLFESPLLVAWTSIAHDGISIKVEEVT